MLDNFRIIRDLKPGSVFLAVDDQNEQWVIKKSPHTSQIVKLSQIVHEKGGDLAEIMPEFFGEGESLRQRFLTWQLAGDTVKTFGTEDSSFEHIDAEKMGRAIGQLQKINFSDSALETRGAGFYLANIFEFKPALTEEFGRDFAAKVDDFLRAKNALIDRYSYFLSNGDVHPQNIMYQKNKFIIIDWDLLQFNNPGWDICDLYVWGWRNKAWGEKLLKSYLEITQPANFKEIFAFDVVYLTSQLIKHAKLVDAPAEFLDAQKKILKEYL